MSSCVQTVFLDAHLQLATLLGDEYGRVPLHTAEVGDFVEQLSIAKVHSVCPSCIVVDWSFLVPTGRLCCRHWGDSRG
jgi:hypothetical protein